MVDLTHVTRWITASIIKHVDGNRQDVSLYVEGATRETQKAPRYLEVRIDGPLQRPCGSKDEYAFDVDVDILCSTTLDEKDIYAMQKLLGIASQALNQDISVFRYGNLEGTDDNSLVGCLQLKGKLGGIHAHDFGQIEAVTKLIQGSVEAHYEMYL